MVAKMVVNRDVLLRACLGFKYVQLSQCQVDDAALVADNADYRLARNLAPTTSADIADFGLRIGGAAVDAR